MGAMLAVDDWGAASPAAPGDPLVLIHGLATTRSIWDLVVPSLARAHRLITLDVPGFGESAPVGTGFALDAVADRIARGLAARGVRGPFDLVGHSLGAGIATMLAVRRPASVRRLVLVAPAGLEAMPPSLSRVFAASAEPLLALRRALVPLADFSWGRRLLLAGSTADGAEVAPGIARRMVIASAGAQRTTEALATIGQGRLAALLAQTAAPLGLIWGEADRTVPARHVRAVREIRPDVQVELLADAGHVPMVERPAAFAEALELVLARMSVPDSGG